MRNERYEQIMINENRTIKCQPFFRLVGLVSPADDWVHPGTGSVPRTAAALVLRTDFLAGNT